MTTTETDARLLDDERALLAAGDPWGELLRLDRELAALRRDDPSYPDALAAFDAQAQAADPARCFAAGLREHRRVDLVATRPWCRLHDLLDLPESWSEAPWGSDLGRRGRALIEASAKGEFVVERALRPADAAAALARLSDPEVPPEMLGAEARANGSATALESLRPMLPSPLRRLIPQPAFNRTWSERAPGEQFDPGVRQRRADSEWDVVLDDLGPSRTAALFAIRDAAGIALSALREAVATLPRVVASSQARDRAEEMVARWRGLGVRAHLIPSWWKTTEPVWPEGPDDLRIRAGHPWLVEVVANDRALAVLEPDLHWIGPHELASVPVVRATVALDALLGDPGAHLPALRRAIEVVVASRRAVMVTCETCGKSTPPEWGGPECHGCMERRGVVF